jgi:serine/threonine protein phosphatase 1
MKNNYGIDNHRKYKINHIGRDFFLGDLHGSIQLLNKALKKIKFNIETDRIFCVGDVIDRGDASAECLKLCKNNWFFSVLGNHEAMLLESKDNFFKKEVWFRNGGQWWAEVSFNERSLLEEIILEEFCVSLSVETAFGNVGVIHSGYPFGEWPLQNDEELNKSHLKNILWDREILKESQTKIITGVSLIISGHTPIDAPTLLGNHLFIDTGCGHYANENLRKPRLTLCEIASSTNLLFHELDYKSYRVTDLSI